MATDFWPVVEPAIVVASQRECSATHTREVRATRTWIVHKDKIEPFAGICRISFSSSQNQREQNSAQKFHFQLKECFLYGTLIQTGDVREFEGFYTSKHISRPTHSLSGNGKFVSLIDYVRGHQNAILIATR
jgi:hypothetical protein